MRLPWRLLRGSRGAHVNFRQCSRCARLYTAAREVCVVDGEPLEPPDGIVRDRMLGRTLLDRYRLEGRIGQGGHGAVYVARQLSIGRDVAIKLLMEQPAQDAEIVQRFEREARIISQLRHPNTLELYDFGQSEDGQVFLVTELLEGAALDQTLKAGPLSEARTLRILYSICGALAEAHHKGVIHRDLKPPNVFLADVSGEEVVKVLDFGIARLAEDGIQTATGKLFGTPTYMSPEQARGDTLDARTDLYSLGVLAYQCLSGQVPFRASTPMGLLMKHVQEDPPAFDALKPPTTISEPVRALVFSLLAKLPDDRPPTADAVRAEIAGILNTRPTASLQFAAQPRAAGDGRARSRSRRWVALAALTALTGGAVWSVWPSSVTDRPAGSPVTDTPAAKTPQTVGPAVSPSAQPETAQPASSATAASTPSVPEAAAVTRPAPRSTPAEAVAPRPRRRTQSTKPRRTKPSRARRAKRGRAQPAPASVASKPAQLPALTPPEP